EWRMKRIDSGTGATSWGSLRGVEIADARVEAVITTASFSEPGLRTGMWLRYQDERNFLAFMISSTGAYRIARFQDGYTDLVEWTPAPALRTGEGVVNTLRVDSRGDTFDFFINGQFMVTVTDSTWPTGRFAFWGASNDPPTSFYLDYFRICRN